MSLKELLLDSSGIIFLALTFIEISPVKINPWSWFSKRIGRAINEEMFIKVEQINKRLDTIDRKMHESDAERWRQNILEFGDDLLHDHDHSKERYDNILMDISYYENYCREHPEFKNNRANMTIEQINRAYSKHIEQHDFL